MRKSTGRLSFCFLHTLPFTFQLENFLRFCGRLFLTFSVHYFIFLWVSIDSLSNHQSRFRPPWAFILSFLLHRLHLVHALLIKLFSFKAVFFYYSFVSWDMEHRRTDMIKRVAEILYSPFPALLLISNSEPAFVPSLTYNTCMI